MNLHDRVRQATTPSYGCEGQTLLVPPQPPGVPLGRVYLGEGLGSVPYTGTLPRAGDAVTIIGDTARPLALTGQAVQPMRSPLLGGTVCKCKCPQPAGVAFYMTFAKQTAVVHVIDGTSGSLLQMVGMNQIGYASFGLLGLETFAGSITVDQNAPHDLFVLDDRRNYSTVVDGTHPIAIRGYIGVLKFSVVAGQYTYSDWFPITDPWQPGSGGPVHPTPGNEPDPPALPGNCLSLLEGEPVVTMLNAPARYLRHTGGVYVTHALTLNGSPYAAQLWGNVVKISDRPANTNAAYVIARHGNPFVYEVLEFDPGTDVISRVITLTLDHAAKQLSSVCQRLVVLSASLDSFGSFIIE